MKNFFPAALLLLGFALLLGGCATFDTAVEKGHDVAKARRIFIVSNLNDNHGLDQRIVAALQARGREASAGPLTMMPDNTQAVLEYRDNWAWDFEDHLVFLKLTLRDAHAEQAYAHATFSAKIPLKESLETLVDRLVEKLVPTKP